MTVRSESPRDEEPAISNLEEAVLEFLEDQTEFPSILNDQIVALVNFHEKTDAKVDAVYLICLAAELRRMAAKIDKDREDRRCAMCKATNMTACHCRYK